MSNPTNDVFWVNESKDDPDSVAHSNDWIYIQHDDKEPSVIRYDLFVKQVFPAGTKKQVADAAFTIIFDEYRIYNLQRSKEEVIKILSNMRFAVRVIQNLYDISDQKILQANADSLSNRYKELTKE